MSPLRIAIDGGALLRPQTGIGRYTRSLLDALLQENALQGSQGDEHVLFLNSFRGLGELVLPRGARLVNPGLPSRILRGLWERSGWPPADDLCGGVDVFHTSDWVHPPLSTAASVTTIHDIGALIHPEWYSPDVVAIHRRKNVLAAERADGIVAISEFTKAELLGAFGIPPERVHVVYNGVSPEFRPSTESVTRRVRDRFSLPERFLLYVGTREPRKNLRGLVRIFERVASEDEAIGLVIVGLTGQESERHVQGSQAWTGDPLTAACHPKELGPRVRVLGQVALDELIALYGTAEALCFPTLYEGFGLPLLEAMACGCPVVASNTTAVPEVVGDAGVLVDPLDEDGFAEATLSLLKDSGEQRRLGEVGILRAEAFSWSRTAKGTRAVYRSVR